MLWFYVFSAYVIGLFLFLLVTRLFMNVDILHGYRYNGCDLKLYDKICDILHMLRQIAGIVVMGWLIGYLLLAAIIVAVIIIILFQIFDFTI